MDIKTKFGLARNVQLREYGANGTYALGYISQSDNKDKYELLGFDAPIQEDPNWRFWVECGDEDGSAETYDAGISECDMRLIKDLYEQYDTNKYRK